MHLKFYLINSFLDDYFINKILYIYDIILQFISFTKLKNIMIFCIIKNHKSLVITFFK